MKKKCLVKLITKYRFFHDLIRFPKRVYQRIKYGFCDIDTWDVENYLDSVLPNILDYLGDNFQGYPGVKPFDTPEKWEEALHSAAEKIRTASMWEEWENPFREEWDNYIIEKFSNRGSWVKDEEFNSLRENYLAKEMKNYDESVAMRNEALDFIKENYNRLID